jgi:uncharacterized protein (TIGR02246 family)
MRKIITNGSLLLLIVLFTLSCDKTKVTSGFDTAPKKEINLAEAQDAVISLNEVFVIALNKGDAQKMADCYTTDAKYMLPNGKSISGKENIKTYFENMITSGLPTFTSKTTGTWGDSGTMTAELEWILADKTGKIVDNGKALELLKIENGKWKIYRDIHNSDNPCNK